MFSPHKPLQQPNTVSSPTYPPAPPSAARRTNSANRYMRQELEPISPSSAARAAPAVVSSPAASSSPTSAATGAVISQCISQTDKLFREVELNSPPGSLSSPYHHHNINEVTPASILSVHRQMLQLMEHAVQTQQRQQQQQPQAPPQQRHDVVVDLSSSPPPNNSDRRSSEYVAMILRMQLQAIEFEETIDRTDLERYANDYVAHFAVSMMHRAIELNVPYVLAVYQQQYLQQQQQEEGGGDVLQIEGNNEVVVRQVLGEKHPPGQGQMLLVEFSNGDSNWVDAEAFRSDPVVSIYLANAASLNGETPPSTTPLRDLNNSNYNGVNFGGSYSAASLDGSTTALGLVMMQHQQQQQQRLGTQNINNISPANQTGGSTSMLLMGVDSPVQAVAGSGSNANNESALGATERNMLSAELAALRRAGPSDSAIDEPLHIQPAAAAAAEVPVSHHQTNAYDYEYDVSPMREESEQQQQQHQQQQRDQIEEEHADDGAIVVNVDENVVAVVEQKRSSISPSPPEPAPAQSKPVTTENEERIRAVEERREQLRRLRESAERQLLDLHAESRPTTNTATTATAGVASPRASANEAEKLLDKLRADIAAAENERIERQRRRQMNRNRPSGAAPSMEEEL